MDRLKDSELLSTTDAQVWAQQFNLVLASRYPGGPVDEGWLIGWFANAIETGRNAGLRQSLSQEAVREEALGEAYLAGFNASGEGYNGEYPFGDNNENPADNEGWRQSRDEYIAKALKREPNAALPEGFRAIDDVVSEIERDPVRKGELDKAREHLREFVSPAPAAPSSSPGIPSDGTIHEGTAPQGASALNEMEGSTLTHAVAVTPDVASMVKHLREASRLITGLGLPAIAVTCTDAAALLAKLGQGWIPVSERLPKIGQEILKWTGRRGRIEVDLYARPDWFEEQHTTYWMPLPPAPGVSDD